MERDNNGIKNIIKLLDMRNQCEIRKSRHRGFAAAKVIIKTSQIWSGRYPKAGRTVSALEMKENSYVSQVPGIPLTRENICSGKRKALYILMS